MPLENGLYEVTFDVGLEAKPPQDAPKELDPQGLAEVRARAARKLQGDVVLIALIGAEGVDRGEVVAELGIEIDVVLRHQGEARAAGQLAKLRRSNDGEESHQLLHVETHRARPADPGVCEAAP